MKQARKKHAHIPVFVPKDIIGKYNAQLDAARERIFANIERRVRDHDNIFAPWKAVLRLFEERML